MGLKNKDYLRPPEPLDHFEIGPLSGATLAFAQREHKCRSREQTSALNVRAGKLYYRANFWVAA